MRVLALALLAAVASASSGAAAAPNACPGARGLGVVRFVHRNLMREVSLATCAARTVGNAPPFRWGPVASHDGHVVATVRSSGHGRTAKETIWVTDRRAHTSRAVFVETEYYKEVTGLESPGPIELLRVSYDGRFVFFAVDPDSSASIAADGLILRVVPATGGPARELGVSLAHPDYLTWCAGRLIWIAGSDRVAIHAKQLLEAAPPDWQPHPLWADPARSFASPSCAPDRRSVAVLSQRSSNIASFFAARWRLWRVGLDDSRRLLDVPPFGVADEQPTWSRDGRSILFIRERHGYGFLMLWRNGRVDGPYASLGYNLGYYGHHAWRFTWSAAA